MTKTPKEISIPEKIQIVDTNDRLLGSSTRQEAWANGSYYRLVQIVLQDRYGNFLLQRRSPEKTLYPNRWTNTASGHVGEGETYEIAAQRELKEELDIRLRLEFIGKVFVQREEGDKKIRQFNGVFIGIIARAARLTLQPEEVSDTRWFTPDELREKIATHPEEFTPALVEIVQEFY